MNAIIFRNQNAFIPEKLITGNIMVAHELLHTLKKYKRDKVGKIAVKLDMSKAYDRTRRPYIEMEMLALSFKEKWIRLVLSYISLVTYLVLLNGTLGKVFYHTKGLR